MSDSVSSSSSAYLQNLYNQLATTLSGSTPVTTQLQDTQKAMQAYATTTPGATVQGFESSFKLAEGSKASAKLNNFVAAEVLPTGAEPAGTAVAAVDGKHSPHGGGRKGSGSSGSSGSGSSTDTTLVWDASTNTMVPENQLS